MKIKKISWLMLSVLLFSMMSGCGKAGDMTKADNIDVQISTEEIIANATEEPINGTQDLPEDSMTTEEDAAIDDEIESADDGIVDLTVLSSTMVYSEVYNMLAYPEQYMGKTVKMEGAFAVYEGENRNYYACIVADATACCTSGIEFVCAEEYIYPDDYPEAESEIVVQGVFDLYEEDGFSYLQLVDATMDRV